MSLPETASLAERVSILPQTEQDAILADLDLDNLLYDWTFWGRTDQHEPPGEWSIWLAMAGRGWGKTRVGAEWTKATLCGSTPLSRGRFVRMALVAETKDDGRDVMIEGPSGILRSHPPAFRPIWIPSKRRLEWPNGARAYLYNAVEPDQLRGPQHDCAWSDELAKWKYVQETWDQLQFGLRLGTDPRQVVTTTPRPIPALREIIKNPRTVITRGETYDNRSNLAPSFFSNIVSRYEGTRLGRQELLAELLDDVPGALWTRAMIDKDRLRAGDTVPDMNRVVVAIDPSGTKGDSDGANNEVGIVAAGRGVDGRGYVLADRTCDLSPEGWGRRAIEAYREFSADRIVAEINYGGAMVGAVIKSIDRTVSYKTLTASRGKVVRAEPVAALYEQGKISHVGSFPLLEDQLVAFTGSGYVGEGSPDRGDALVWALTELMLGGPGYRLNL